MVLKTYEEIAAALPDPVILIGSLGELLWANRAAERFLDVPLSEVLGRNIVEFVHPDDVQTAMLAVVSVRDKDVGSLLEVRVRSVDGWRLVEVRGAPLGAEILLAVRDITDRRRWEVGGNDVARSRALIQNGTTVTILLDRLGTIRATSAVVTRLLGHDQETLEGQPFANIVDRLDAEELAVALDDVSSSERTSLAVDLRLRTSDGAAVPYAMTLTNLLDDPTLEGIVVTGHNISDRVIAENALRESNSLLATTLESTADGVLAVDSTGKISNFNRRFADMWRLPEHILASRDDERALACVLDQLSDPDAFLAKVQELYATPDAHSHDVLQFNDGRVFERNSLPRRIGDEIVGRVWSFHDITEQEQLKQELAHRALHDSLTGLPNQTLFRDRIDQAARRLHRHGHQIAVLFIDLDDFKRVNDTLGHWAGDALLVRTCQRLLHVLRREDTPARLGGDEFAVLVDDLTDPAEAVDIARRVIESLVQPIMLAANELTITVSIGIAYGEAGTNADELLRNADLAMYGAKGSGKNCQMVYDPAMHSAARQRLNVDSNTHANIQR